MNRLCDTCKRNAFEKTCFIPTGDKCGGSYWKKNREVLNEDGTCDHYDGKNFKDVFIDHIKTPYYKVVRTIDNVKDFFRFRIIGQVKHGFDIRDSWNLHASTAEFMLPRLRKFIDDEPMGVPCSLSTRSYVDENNLAQYFDGELKDEWFAENHEVDEHMKAWIKILEKIYDSLDYVVNQWEDRFDCFYTNEYGEKELDKPKWEAMHKEIEEGFRLLGLFFQNLWD